MVGFGHGSSQWCGASWFGAVRRNGVVRIGVARLGLSQWPGGAGLGKEGIVAMDR